MDEDQRDNESDDWLGDNSNQRTLLKLIFEVTPFGLAVVKEPELTFELANAAYQKLCPDADVDPIGHRYEDVWPLDVGFESVELLRDVVETGKELDLDDHQLIYPDGSRRNCGLRIRSMPWADALAVLIIIWDFDELAQGLEQSDHIVRSREAELEAAVAECLEEMRKVERYLFENVEAQRKELSEYLHNGPVQELYAVLFQLHTLRGELKQGPVIDALEPIFSRIAEVGKVLGKIYNELWPSTLASYGLASAMNGHVRRLQESHSDIEFHVDFKATLPGLPEDLRLALFRIYEEGVKNVIKHAQAQRVDIRFSSNGEIVIEIQDDGQGFSVPDSWDEFAQNGQYGLMQAAERARVFGGRLEVVSEKGNGCMLKVTMPRDVGE